jgi:hypothetical protein
MFRLYFFIVCCLVSLSAAAQNGKISGQVLTSDGDTAGCFSISLKELKTDTFTMRTADQFTNWTEILCPEARISIQIF